MTYVINPVAVSALPLAMDGRRTHHLKQNKPSVHLIRCLVVDDDYTILKYVAHMLAMLGFQEVETAQRQPEVMIADKPKKGKSSVPALPLEDS